MTTRAKTIALATAVAALLYASPASAATRGLSRSERAAFGRTFPSLQACHGTFGPVLDDMQQTKDNFSAGDTDYGSLRTDARAMRDTCLGAAGIVYRLRFGRNETLARRVQAEDHAALVDSAQGGAHLMTLCDDVDGGDYAGAMDEVQRTTGAWNAASAHLQVATALLTR